MDCLQPPLDESPPGSWHCPICPPLEPDPDTEMDYYTSNPAASHDAYERYGQSSEPSSSQQRSPNSYQGGGRQKSKASEGEDDGSDVDMVEDEEEDEEGGEEETKLHIPRTLPKKGRKRRPSKKTRVQYDSDDDEPVSLAVNKRSRGRGLSPARSRVIVRLRIPGKGKEREEEEQKGLFDDILGVTDRDTVKTAVENGDKMKFERSRIAADVSNFYLVTYSTYRLSRRRNLLLLLLRRHQILQKRFTRGRYIALPDRLLFIILYYQSILQLQACQPHLRPRLLVQASSLLLLVFEYALSDLGSMTYRPGTMLRFPRNMQIFQMVACGYVNSV